MTRARVVVAGLGDSGLLTAIHLSRHPGVVDVVGISSKPELVSGQELGMRLARPDEWARDYRIAFDRYRRLDRVRRVHATLTGLDVGARKVRLTTAEGEETEEPYDVLVISTGVTNGFWRRPALQTHRGDRDRPARAARPAGGECVGDRRRGWGRGGEQRGEPGPHLAGQAGRRSTSRASGRCPSTTAACGARSRPG